MTTTSLALLVVLGLLVVAYLAKRRSRLTKSDDY
jgi:hypothetical protein